MWHTHMLLESRVNLGCPLSETATIRLPPRDLLATTPPISDNILSESDDMLLARYGLPPLARSAYNATDEELARVVKLCFRYRADILRLAALANSHRKVNRLPRVILSEVFKWVREVEGWDWLRLLQVCQLWRSVALSDATLWANISLQGSKSDIKYTFLKMCIARSKNAKLEVALQGNAADWKVLHICPCYRRLRGLHLYELDRGASSRILAISKPVYPVLTALTLSESQPGASRPTAILLTKSRFPSLRHLSLCGVIVNPGSSVLPSITILHLEKIRLTQCALAVILSKCTQLRHLSLAYVPFQGLDSQIPAHWRYDVDASGLDTPHGMVAFKARSRLDALQSMSTTSDSFESLHHLLPVLQLLHISAQVSLSFHVKLQSFAELDMGIITVHTEGVFSQLIALVPSPHQEIQRRLQVSLSYEDCTITYHQGPTIIRLQYDHHQHGGADASWHEAVRDSEPAVLDLRHLSNILRSLPPINDVEIRYVGRTACRRETLWRKFLAHFPHLRRLSVDHELPDWGKGIVSMLAALNSPNPPLQPSSDPEEATPSVHASPDTDVIRTDVLPRQDAMEPLCPKLEEVIICSTLNAEDLRNQLERLVRARPTIMTHLDDSSQVGAKMFENGSSGLEMLARDSENL